MKKITIILMILIITVIFTGCATSEQNVVWRLGHEEVVGSIMDEYALEFKRIVEEESDGRIEVAIYRTGEIGGAVDYQEFLQDGLLNFGIINPGTSGTTIPENNVFYNHFFLPQNLDDLQEVLNTSEGIELLNEINLRSDIKILDWFVEGYNAWTSNNEITSPKDFNGVSIRTMSSPLIIANYSAYGANPTPMAYTEVYSGLQLNQIDAQVNPLFAIEEMKFYEVQKYLIMANQDAFVASFVVNPEFYENLSDEDKKIVEDAVEKINPYIFEVQDRINKERLEKIRANSNINIIELTPEQVEEFRKASESARSIYFRSVGEEGRKIFEMLEKDSAKYNQ